MNTSKPEDANDRPPPNSNDIDDERKYTTKEAGEFLHLKWRTIVAYIYNGKLHAERQEERRGPVYYISGAEIKRFRQERKPLGYPNKKEVKKDL